MDRKNMIKKLKDQIIPGVIPEKQEIATEILNILTLKKKTAKCETH